MHGNVAHDSGEGRGQSVVSQLALLGDVCSFGGLPIRLGIVKRLHRLFIILLAGYTRIKQMLLPVQFTLGIVENAFF